MDKEDFVLGSAIGALATVSIPFLPFAGLAILAILPFAAVGTMVGGIYFGSRKLAGHIKRKKRHEEYVPIEKEQYEQYIDKGAENEGPYRVTYGIALKSLHKPRSEKINSDRPRLFICDRLLVEKINKDFFENATEVFAYCKSRDNQCGNTYAFYFYEFSKQEWQEISIPPWRYGNEIPGHFHIRRNNLDKDNKLRVHYLTDDELAFLNELVIKLAAKNVEGNTAKPEEIDNQKDAEDGYEMRANI